MLVTEAPRAPSVKNHVQASRAPRDLLAKMHYLLGGDYALSYSIDETELALDTCMSCPSGEPHPVIMAHTV